MPIYDLSYRSYEGTLRSRWRWAVMIDQEIRILRTKRLFLFLVLLGNFHLILRVIQIFAFDTILQNPTLVLFGGLSSENVQQVGAWVYFDFLRIQSPLIFLTLIYAGSGLICNDFRNNLTEIYFSKPINWRDYAAGKILSLVTIGMGLTALPALVMGLLHVCFNPSRAVMMETLKLAPAIVLFSLLLVGSISLVILACSCLVNSAKFTGISVFMIVLVNIALGGMLAELLLDRDYSVLAYPVSINILGEHLFNEHRYRDPISISWTWCAAYAAVVCTIALAIICQKARRAELGR